MFYSTKVKGGLRKFSSGNRNRKFMLSEFKFKYMSLVLLGFPCYAVFDHLIAQMFVMDEY